MKKNLITFVLFSLFALVITGCGNNNQKTKKQSPILQAERSRQAQNPATPSFTDDSVPENPGANPSSQKSAFPSKSNYAPLKQLDSQDKEKSTHPIATTSQQKNIILSPSTLAKPKGATQEDNEDATTMPSSSLAQPKGTEVEDTLHQEDDEDTTTMPPSSLGQPKGAAIEDTLHQEDDEDTTTMPPSSLAEPQEVDQDNG